jgi:hypothetical protein
MAWYGAICWLPFLFACRKLFMELLMLLELVSPERCYGDANGSLATATPPAGDAAAAAPLPDLPGSCSTDVEALKTEAAETAAATAEADVSAVLRWTLFERGLVAAADVVVGCGLSEAAEHFLFAHHGWLRSCQPCQLLACTHTRIRHMLSKHSIEHAHKGSQCFLAAIRTAFHVYPCCRATSIRWCSVVCLVSCLVFLLSVVNC